MNETFYRWEGETLLLRLRVQPRASRNALGEPIGDRLKVYLTASPIEGQANAVLIAFMSDVFDVSKSRIHLRRGARGREKELAILAPGTLPAGITVAGG